MKGLKIGLEKFMRGACKEGHDFVMARKDLERSWNEAPYPDWLLWLLRRQISTMKIRGPLRDIVCAFYAHTDDSTEHNNSEYEQSLADNIRAVIPNPFTPAGYHWLTGGKKR